MFLLLLHEPLRRVKEVTSTGASGFTFVDALAFESTDERLSVACTFFFSVYFFDFVHVALIVDINSIFVL